MLIWCSRGCIVWLLDFIRDRSETFEGVRVGAKWTGICPSRLSILIHIRLLVRHLVELPEASEALLSAEERGGQAKLDAGWTLHSSFVRAIRCCTSLLRRLCGDLGVDTFLLLIWVG